jgi:hypothetical protein
LVYKNHQRWHSTHGEYGRRLHWALLGRPFFQPALFVQNAPAVCSAYLELNPIRARIADSLIDSDHTSIKRRCEQVAKAVQPNEPLHQAGGLHLFAGNLRRDMSHGLPFRLTDYLELVDWTSKILRDDKCGAISKSTPKILQQLNIDPKHWCYLSQNFKSQFKSLIGTSYHIKQACEQLGKQWVDGIRACENFFLT